MFWLRNKKIIFSYTLLSGGLLAHFDYRIHWIHSIKSALLLEVDSEQMFGSSSRNDLRFQKSMSTLVLPKGLLLL